MKIAFRILSLLISIFFLVMGLGWIVDPGAAAEAAGMTLLTGLAASTQIGDIGALFLSVGFFAAFGQLPGRSHWFLASAFILATVAVMRTLAWGLGYADFALPSVVGEVVFTTILVTAARLRENEG